MFEVPQSSRNLRALYGALVVLLGVQSIRFLFGSISWYLRDTVGIGVLNLVPIALAPFVLGLLIPSLTRRLTVGAVTWTATVVLVGARILTQVSDEPSVGLWTSAVATMAFVGLLPLILSMGRSALVGGVLLGIALDSAVRGMSLSLDIGYQTGIGPLAVIGATSIAALYLLWAGGAMESQGVPMARGVLLAGLGPFLFFQFLILQNQGWISEVAGVGGPHAQLRIALLNVAALFLVARFDRNRAVVLGALVLLVVTLVVSESFGLAFNILSVVAIPAAALVWASLVPDTQAGGIAASTTFLTVGMVLFVVLGLAYYVPLDLDLGFTQAQARLAAVVLLALFGLGGVLSEPPSRPSTTRQAWAFAAMASFLPLVGLLTASLPDLPSPSGDWPLRVMTYNIHSGYDTSGRFSIDELAQVIEDSEATVVGLQEVSRGWLIAGANDQLVLLQQRLGFEHAAFFGTTDPVWGNAILSRYPITSVEREYLPLEGTLLRRGYLAATLDFGGEELLFVSIHLQHINDSAAHELDPEGDLYPVHHEQISVILGEWAGRQPAVMVGDFNARPGWQQLEELIAAGWVDVWQEAGVGEGFTSDAADPQHRIDYIFHTQDLVAQDAGVIQSQASDHFPVVADLTMPE